MADSMSPGMATWQVGDLLHGAEPTDHSIRKGERNILLAEKDRPTVTVDGQRLIDYIEGVQLRLATTHLDDRGDLCEILNPAWDFSSEPIVYVYQASVRPGKIKGWVYHKEQDDRLFISYGSLKIVLYDLRENSLTKGMVNEIYLGERKRGLLLIPRMVAHAVQNVGDTEAMFINLPTRPYQHDNPDKYRISIDSGAIPYRFALA